MTKITGLFLLVFYVSGLFAGGSMSGIPLLTTQKYDNICVSINFKDIGIANLNIEISIKYQRYFDKKIFQNNEYDNFISEIKLNTPSIALDEISKYKEINTDNLNEIRINIDKEIIKYIELIKSKKFPGKPIPIELKVTSIFITSINTEVNKNNKNNYYDDSEVSG